MEETLISFETAKLAKEIGFNWPTRYYYDFIGDRGSDRTDVNWNQSKEELYSAPTQSLLQKWLREIHNIMFVIKPFYDNSMKKTTYVADPIIAGKTNKIAREDTYEEALEVGLFEALKLIKTKIL
jgi:hypothetical protein